MERIRGWEAYAQREELIALRAMRELMEELQAASSAAFAVAGAIPWDDHRFRMIGIGLCDEWDRVAEHVGTIEDKIATRALGTRGRIVQRIRASAKADPLTRPLRESIPDDLPPKVQSYGSPAVEAINAALDEKERQEHAAEVAYHERTAQPSGQSCAFGHPLTVGELEHGECAACEDGAGSEELAAAELLADEPERFACLHGHRTTARELCGAGCEACAAEGRPGMKIAAPALPPAVPIGWAAPVPGSLGPPPGSPPPPAEEPKPKRKRSSAKCRKAGHVRTPEDLIHGGCAACVLASAGMVPPAVEAPAVELADEAERKARAAAVMEGARAIFAPPAQEAPPEQPGLPFVGGDL